ncbi:hypothetical protein [Streptomyces sp. NPDC015414]|uniref:hypothetical protein n=1 Tax=Streptomyces sp. NPDC015414 TaxID=3364957 RepID=UPI0036F869B4
MANTSTMGAWIPVMACKEGPEVLNSHSQNTLQKTILGQPAWDVPAIAPHISALEGSLPEISAFWIMCDPVGELACLQETVAAFTDHQLFTWSTRILAEEQPPPSEDSRVYLRRFGRRAGLAKFSMLPFVKSTYLRHPRFQAEDHGDIEPLPRRNSGYALGIGAAECPSERWTGAAQLLEGHFSLAFDFENTVEMESLRRKLVALYVSTAIEMDLMPLIPLNRHPAGGHVLFCRSSSYSTAAEALAEHSAVREGDSATQELITFLDSGGGLAYL